MNLDLLWGWLAGVGTVLIPIGACSYYYAKHPGKFMRQIVKQASRKGV